MAAAKNLTPEQRTLRAQIAAHTQWANTENRTTRTAAARKAAEDRFDRLADPDGLLSPEVRKQRAESLRKAHFRRMAMKSAASRSRKAAAKKR